MSTTVYAPTAKSSLRGKARIQTYTRFTAPNGNVITAMGLGVPAGFNVGARCNRLYVNMGLSILLPARAASAAGGTKTAIIDVPFQTSYTGITIWAQSAWTDSRINRFALTTARRNDVPASPRLYKKKMVYGYPNTRPVAVTGASTSPVRQTLPRLTFK